MGEIIGQDRFPSDIRDIKASGEISIGIKSGDGGGGSMEARIAKLESHVEYIKRDIAELKTDVKEVSRDLRTDFRINFGALITVAVALAGLMAKGFHWL